MFIHSMQLNYIFFQSLPFPQFPSQPKQTSQRLTQIKECGTSQSLMEAISLVLWHFIWVNRGSKKWKVTDNYLTLRRSFCFFDSCNFCPLMAFSFWSSKLESLKAQYNKCLNQIQLFRGKNKLWINFVPYSNMFPARHAVLWYWVQDNYKK